MDLLERLERLDYQLDITEAQISGPIVSSIKSAVKRVLKEKQKNERGDKFARSKLKIFNIGTKFWDIKKKSKDKNIQAILEQIIHGFYYATNDEQFKEGEK